MGGNEDAEKLEIELVQSEEGIRWVGLLRGGAPVDDGEEDLEELDNALSSMMDDLEDDRDDKKAADDGEDDIEEDEEDDVLGDEMSDQELEDLIRVEEIRAALGDFDRDDLLNGVKPIKQLQ